MEAKTVENTNTQEPAKKPRKSATVAKPTRTIDDLSMNERVAIDNLASWGINYVSEETGRDVRIDGYVKNFKRFKLSEIDAEVKIGNIAFCGSDGLGSHAMIRIADPLVRKYVFGEDISPIQLTEDAVRDLLDTENKKEFNEKLSTLVVTNSEKRMIVAICEKIGIDNVPSFKLAAIENISGIKFED